MTVFRMDLWTVGADSSKAKLVKREASKVLSLLKEISDDEAKLQEAINNRSIPGVEEALDTLLSLLKEKEEKLIDMVNLELILQLHQVQGLDALDEAIKDKNDPAVQAKLQELKRNVEQLLVKSKEDIGSARQEARILAGKIADTTRFVTTKDEPLLLDNIKKYARKERRETIRTEDMEDLIKKLKNKSADASDIDKLQKDVEAEERLEKEEYMVEHWVYLLITYLMDDFKEIANEIAKLHSAGFPQEALGERALKLNQLRTNLHHRLVDLVEMSDTVKRQA